MLDHNNKHAERGQWLLGGRVYVRFQRFFLFRSMRSDIGRHIYILRL